MSNDLQNSEFVFDHERLDAYKLALEWLEIAERIAVSLPRGRGPLADQLRRASSGIPLTIAEGVPRRGADRARFYETISKAPCCVSSVPVHRDRAFVARVSCAVRSSFVACVTRCIAGCAESVQWVSRVFMAPPPSRDT